VGDAAEDDAPSRWRSPTTSSTTFVRASTRPGVLSARRFRSRA